MHRHIDNMNAFRLHILTGTHWMMFVSFKFELVGQRSSDSWIIIQFKTDEMWGSRLRFEEFFILSILFSTLVIALSHKLIDHPIWLPCSRVSEGFLLVLWLETATFRGSLSRPAPFVRFKCFPTSLLWGRQRRVQASYFGDQNFLNQSWGEF